MNHALCNAYKTLVPARTEERDGKVFLVKDCPECGTTETLISGDAPRYQEKHGLDCGYPPQVCKLDCLQCRHRQHPTLIFVDITNRCNLNCPICINNTPAMGFLFEPPTEYFDRIFRHFAAYDPKPAVQLFGGEPTVRDDLFEIIQMARSAGLAVRVVTNGIKLADEDYCRRLIRSRATILIAYDGNDPRTYSVLRGTEKALDRKLKAIENIRTIGGAKLTFMTLVARDFNDRELPQLFQFCHDCRDVVRAIYLMPLAHTWDDRKFDLRADRITTEDVENMVDDAFPDDAIRFMPASFLGSLQALLKCLNVKPLPFVGAHPNCESMYLLISDGERFLPLARYLKTSTRELCEALQGLDARLARHFPADGSKPKGLRMALLRLRAFLGLAPVMARHVRLGQVIQGRGPLGKLYHGLAMVLGFLFRRKSRLVFERHTDVQGVLQIIVLPFEDSYNIETDRLERCPASFAFVDPETDEVKSVPVCAWGLHKERTMRAIADRYERQAVQLPAGR